MAKKVVTTINGKLVSDSQAKISVYDNSLLYAEGLFETYMAVKDRLAFPKEHFERLQKGANLLGIKIPVESKVLIKWLSATAGKHPAKLKRLRLTITSGDSPVWRGNPGKPRIIISAIEHKFDLSPQKLYVPEFRVDGDSSFNHIKTIAYGLRAAALRQAQKNNCEDALLLNNRDNITELTSANIFWVKNGRIFTPPISAGCLEGVTRRIVLEQDKKHNWGIEEKNCTLQELSMADEVFSTSSVRLSRPIGEIKSASTNAKFKQGDVWRKIFNHLCGLLDID
ncbi:MAG TPA: aminotransferase class IV [candidate division Zixibacteria bacterium]|nr:aminotransferase class IV [candidate division Zixibacteria bacterium]